MVVNQFIKHTEFLEKLMYFLLFIGIQPFFFAHKTVIGASSKEINHPSSYGLNLAERHILHHAIQSGHKNLQTLGVELDAVGQVLL